VRGGVVPCLKQNHHSHVSPTLLSLAKWQEAREHLSLPPPLMHSLGVPVAFNRFLINFIRFLINATVLQGSVQRRDQSLTCPCVQSCCGPQKFLHTRVCSCPFSAKRHNLRLSLRRKARSRGGEFDGDHSSFKWQKPDLVPPLPWRTVAPPVGFSGDEGSRNADLAVVMMVQTQSPDAWRAERVVKGSC